MSPSIHTSISISLGASSIAHTPCHSISHPCSPITISRGSLYDKHTLSPPHVCIFSVTSLSPSLPCLSDPSWPRARGLALSVANNHTLSPHLASVVEDASVICLHKTHTFFSTFIECCPCLFHTHTHKHTLSPPHVCIFSVCLSRPLSLACQTLVGHVLGVFLSRLQTTTHYLLTLLPLSKMHV